jgi:type II secretory pathway component PulF
LTWRLAVGEARGTFADALAEAADAYEDELEVRSARVARLIEPAALVLVGVLAATAVYWLQLSRAGLEVFFS